MVIENVNKFRFSLSFNNYQIGTYIDTEIKKSMTTDKFYSSCVDMGNADFPMNKNMCDFVKTTYGTLIIEYTYSLLLPMS